MNLLCKRKNRGISRQPDSKRTFNKRSISLIRHPNVMLSAVLSLIFPPFIKKSTKSTKSHLQLQEYSFWLFLARLSDLYCGNVSKKRFLTSLNVKNFFFISKSLFVCCLCYFNIRAKLVNPHGIFQTFHPLAIQLITATKV